MREYALRLGIDLGSTLSQPETELLAGAGVERQVDTGTILHRQDEPADCLHYLISGMVKTYQVHASGYESVIRIHLAGSFIGLSSLTSRGHWDATSVAQKPSRLIMISKPRFLRLLEENSSLSIKLVQLLVDRLSDLHFRIGELQTQSVEQRLAYALLSLSRADPNGNFENERVAISLTHEELAQLINTRRQTVTSVLRRFTELGYVSRSLRCIEVISPGGLQSCFAYNFEDGSEKRMS
jgi:CRP-like cAMP-binding protein